MLSVLFLFVLVAYANSEDDLQKKPYFGVDGLLLTVKGDLHHAHRLRNIHHRFTRLVEPYKSKHLWWYVQEQVSFSFYKYIKNEF